MTNPITEATEQDMREDEDAVPGLPTFGDWRDTFLRRLAEGESVTAAAHRAGQTRHAPYNARRGCPEFTTAWRVARDAGRSVNEPERIAAADYALWHRHVHGYDKAVTYQGKITDTYTDFDTPAGKIWLTAHDPRYRTPERTPLHPVTVVLHLEGHGGQDGQDTT